MNQAASTAEAVTPREEPVRDQYDFRLACDLRADVPHLCWLGSSSAGSQARLPPSRGSVIIARGDSVSRGVSTALPIAYNHG